MIYVGQEYYNNEESYRVCAVSPCGNYFALADMNTCCLPNMAKPKTFQVKALQDFSMKNRLSERDYELPVEMSLSDKMLLSKGKGKWISKRDRKWQLIRPLISPEFISNYLFGNGIAKEISVHLSSDGWTTKGAFYNALNRYIAMGMTKNALLPVGLKNTGTKAPKYKTVAEIKTKRGRKSQLPLAQTRGVCEADKNNILDVINKFKSANKKFSIQAAYKEFDAKYQRIILERELEDGTQYRATMPLQIEECLSYHQFYYHFSRLVDAETLAKIQHGHLKYAKDLAPRIGSARDGVLGATHRYEVDATVLDVYVAYPYKAGLSVGRPVFYIVVDVYSSMIVGMYLGFSGPDWAGVAQALSNACLNKVDFARRYGVDITEDDWPANHIPIEITMDNGKEYKDSMVSSALKSMLGVSAVNFSAAYRGDAKGTVERQFKCLNDEIVHHLPGSIFKEQDRTETHPSNNAIYNYNDLAKILISVIVCQNQSAVRLKKLNFNAAIDRCDINPQAIYLYSLKNEMRGGRASTSSDEAKVIWAFLPEDEATVTDHGIIFGGLEYISSHPLISAMFAKATQKRFKIPVKRLKDFVNYLWFRADDGEFIRLDLKNVNNSSPYLSQPWEIIEHRLCDEKIIKHEANDATRFARAARDNRIDEVRAESGELPVRATRKSATRKSIQSGMKQRKEEQHMQNRIVEAANLTRSLTSSSEQSTPDMPSAELYDIDNDLFG